MRAHEFYSRGKLVLRSNVHMAEDYAGGALYLVVEKLAEVLHVHFALVGVDDGGEGIYLRVGKVGSFNRLGNVRKFAHARGFD